MGMCCYCDRKPTPKFTCPLQTIHLRSNSLNPFTHSEWDSCRSYRAMEVYSDTRLLICTYTGIFLAVALPPVQCYLAKQAHVYGWLARIHSCWLLCMIHVLMNIANTGPELPWMKLVTSLKSPLLRQVSRCSASKNATCNLNTHCM